MEQKAYIKSEEEEFFIAKKKELRREIPGAKGKIN